MPVLGMSFGGGLNTRVALQDVRQGEAAGGVNFDIEAGDRRLNWRRPFDLVSRAPNGAEIRGYAAFREGDRHVMLVQAGSAMYRWDGSQTWVQIGTVNAQARLRGPQEQYYEMLPAVFLSDLAGVAPVMIASSTAVIPFPMARGGVPLTFFGARYIAIQNERVLYGNITEPAGAFPHLLVGSESENPANVSTADRPSSELGAADPWFLVSPDLRPINGLLSAFNGVYMLTRHGSIYRLTGDSAEDFAIQQFYTSAAAAGDEGFVFDGDDLLYGRQGRIESLQATQNFGDVQTADLTWPVGNDVGDAPSWRLAYNRTTQRIYAFPTGKSECWVSAKPLYRERATLSPWARWTTEHPLLFQPTTVWSAVAPVDGREHVYMGDADGNVFRMEGDGEAGDGGTHAVEARWQSKLFRADGDGSAFYMDGHIDYVPDAGQNVTIRAIYAGDEDVTETVSLYLPGQTTEVAYWGGDAFWGGGSYWNAASARRKRPRRQSFSIPGQSSHMQVSIETTYRKPWTADALEMVYGARPPSR